MHDVLAHEMQFERIHASGEQEWFCPICGRRLLMKWPRAFEKQVLQPGDTNAFHTGGKVGSAVDSATIDDRSGFDLHPSQDIDALRPWLKWASNAGIQDVWDQLAEE